MPETIETNQNTSNTEIKSLQATTVVVDHFFDNEDGSLLAELPRYLTASKNEVSLVHATAAMSNPKLYPKGADKLHPTNSTHATQLKNKLGYLGFEPKQVEQCGMTDDCAQDILETKTSGDFLVTVSNFLQPGAFVRSQFATRLAEYAPCSVLLLTCPISHSTDTLKVLFATDGSEASLKAARRLPELLKTDKMDVNVVTVQTPSYIDNPMLAPFVNIPYMEKAWEENSRLILETTKATLEALGVKVVDTRQLSGPPAYRLMDLAETENPDLIVVGSHNLKGFPAWFLGSVSTQLLHKHRSNLLIVR